MKREDNKGSSFNEFLKKEGIETEVNNKAKELCVNYLHVELKEAYEAVITTSIRYCNDGKSCKHCKELAWGRSSEEKVKHKPDCIVNKAEQWLKENR